MVTAITSTHRSCSSHQNPKRTPLLPSDSANGHPDRLPKFREVNSRYLSLSTTSSSSNSSASTTTTLSSVTSLSSTSSKRIHAPILGRKPVVSTPKTQHRAVSAERRRTPAKTPSGAERMLVTSMRGFSVSFQGESYPLPLSKAKPPPTAAGTPGGSRKGTPERRKPAVTTPSVSDRKERDRENSKPSNQQHQHRWPGRLRSENSNLLTRSADFAAERVQSVGSSPALKDLTQSKDGEKCRTKYPTDLNLENDDDKTPGICELDHQSKSVDSVNSDVESLPSEDATTKNASQSKGKSRGLVVPSRFWQDSSNRVHKVLTPDSTSPNCSSNRKTGPLIAAKKYQSNSPVSSPRAVSASRGLSPHRGVVRPASPSRGLVSSTAGAMLRGFTSPSRAGRGIPISTNELSESSSKCSTPSMFQFALDARKGKLGENRIAEAHDLRLLHNRLLQWRLANAKSDHNLLLQKHTAERSLYNAWATNLQLQHSVCLKRIELQRLRHNLKLYHILKKQEQHLECWSLVDRDHCNSLSAAVEALKATTLRLPIVAGARADVHNIQEAISCAVDTMQAMASSICSLFSKVEEISVVASELSNKSAQGHYLLNECRDYMWNTFIPLQAMHCSMRTQVLQVQQQEVNSVDGKETYLVNTGG